MSVKHAVGLYRCWAASEHNYQMFWRVTDADFCTGEAAEVTINLLFWAISLVAAFWLSIMSENGQKTVYLLVLIFSSTNIIKFK